ncbi:MAG TPA: dihydrolipoamide acetyltransferase family protein [Ktedonobacterales bacterium]|nr:dihydrolipoamide acetyltransferase family protein [Ktedonobacterales bacterium]
MSTKITMPQLGESVSEGTVGRWLKQVGDTVRRDESLVEIITDKVTAELPSPVSGRLTQILVAEDQTVPVGAEIAEIDESAAPSRGTASSASAGAASAGTASASAAPSVGAAPQATPTTTASAAAAPQASAPSPAPASASFPTNGSGPAASSAPTASTATAEKVSPLARRMAQEHGVDLNQIPGTGEGGRVRKEDILAYVAQRGGQPAAAPAAAYTPAPAVQPVPAVAGDELVTPSPQRRAIAEHMVRSKHTSPHATTVFEVDMTNLARWLDRHRDDFKRTEGYGISYQAFVIKAAVEALKEHPWVNASWTEDGKILLRKQINIGVSIALENNLVVPVVRGADTLNVAGIARAVSDLVTRARGNRLTPADMQGATFTVNNPGVFGTLISMAIINQPNAAILTMDAVVKRPMVIDEAIAIRSMMYMSLSFDHRMLDGLIAARFMGAIKRRLESWSPEADVF